MSMSRSRKPPISGCGLAISSPVLKSKHLSAIHTRDLSLLILNNSSSGSRSNTGSRFDREPEVGGRVGPGENAAVIEFEPSVVESHAMFAIPRHHYRLAVPANGPEGRIGVIKCIQPTLGTTMKFSMSRRQHEEKVLLTNPP